MLASLLDTLDHGLFTLTDEDSGIVVLLVGLAGTFGVTDLGGEVLFLSVEVISETDKVSPLGVSVNVHLDNTVGDSSVDILLSGAGTAVEDKEDGLVIISLELLLDISLVLAEKLRVQADVTRSIDTVNVTESSGNGEKISDLRESLVDIPDILRLGIQGSIVNVLVVNTILLSTSDTDFHLEKTANRCKALQVLEADLNVLLLGVLRKIQHVGREEGFTVSLEVSLISLNHTIEPRKELLGAVVRVSDDGNAIGSSDRANIL
jgi:hypothetical protein